MEKAKEREAMYGAIRIHAQILAEEMNLRLLLDRETQVQPFAESIPGADMMLFVESITVTDIQFLQKEKKKGIFAGVRQWMNRISDAVKQFFVRWEVGRK